METVILILEIIGTVAFAAAGAIVGIKKEADLFGVIFLGTITAVGGGVLRDVIIGKTPPTAFVNIIFVSVAILTALIVFVFVYNRPSLADNKKIDNTVNFFDAIGLGAFTINGMNALLYGDIAYSPFLAVFVGVCTGIGGGIMRDVIVNEIPFVLKRERIYAVVSILGGAVYYVLSDVMNVNSIVSMVVGITTIFLVRMCATKYKWKLPRVNH